jgi:hypothetical protein
MLYSIFEMLRRILCETNFTKTFLKRFFYNFEWMKKIKQIIKSNSKIQQELKLNEEEINYIINTEH